MEKPTKKMVIEVADNHPPTATFISQILFFNGHKTYEAYNPEDTIMISKEVKPDLLILDWILENNSSKGIIAQLPQQKIILMDLYGLIKSKYQRYKNVIGFIKKPIDSEKLLETIKKLV